MLLYITKIYRAINLANLNVRVDDDFKVEFDIAVARGRTTLQAAVREAIENWMAEKTIKPGQPTAALTPEESVHVAALLYALRNANDDKLFQIELLLKPFLNKPAAQSPARRKSA